MPLWPRGVKDKTQRSWRSFGQLSAKSIKTQENGAVIGSREMDLISGQNMVKP
jgi:hypothetical protein